MKFGVESAKDLLWETLRFMQSMLGMMTIFVVGAAVLVLEWYFGARGLWIWVTIDALILLIIVLSLPCLDVPSMEYRRWLFRIIHAREDTPEYVKQKERYRRPSDVPGPPVGVAAKSRTRWYERILEE